jgi:hypothetical protein
MELIQSFIAIPEAAAKQQALQKNTNSTVEAYQATQSPELTPAQVLLFNQPHPAVQSTIKMELIESFIAIPEAAVKQQALQKNTNCSIEAYQATQSPEPTPVQVLLFNKPHSAVQSTIQDDTACAKAV